MDSKELLDKISSLEEEVYNYITTTEHWLFYWIHNKEIQDFIEANPEDFEDKVSLTVDSLSLSSSTCTIYFEDHPNEIKGITRSALLTTFRNSVKARWLEWNGRIKEMLLHEKEEALLYHKNIVTELEKDIEKLKAQD